MLCSLGYSLGNVVVKETRLAQYYIRTDEVQYDGSQYEGLKSAPESSEGNLSSSTSSRSSGTLSYTSH